jgi:putative ATP-dependent endonuclease of OLD family
MKITHIRIQNFRSIKQLELSPGGITALVGPNNAGKTNILSAVNFLLGDRFPMIQGLDDKDFYGKTRENGLLVKVWFAPNSERISSVWFEYDPDQREGRARYDRIVGTTVSARPSYLSNDVRKNFALVYIDAARNFEAQFGSSRWSLFGQIVRQLDVYFREQVGKDTQDQVKGNLERAQELLKTDLYRSFEKAVGDAFQDQVRLTTHAVTFDFRTFDPLNFYRALYLVLFEDGEAKNPAEAGSGMRNLVVMALFRAYAKTFKGDALIAIEEPEIYLHPHAQRSLALLFRELAGQGAQLFYSTHSASFLSIEHFDEVAVVERCPDNDGDVCTRIRRLAADDLLAKRQALHAGVAMTVGSMRERLPNACSVEHTEAFYARAVLLVEGETEQAALPVYATAMGVDFDALGVSVVSAGGKTGLDALHQLYDGLGFPVFLLFDNDIGGNIEDIPLNKLLMRLLGLPETDRPAPVVATRYAILEPDFEGSVNGEIERIQAGLYGTLKAEASTVLGAKAGKPIVARYVARRLTERNIIPPTIKGVIEAVQRILAPMEPKESEAQPGRSFDLDDEIPF